MQVLGDLIRLPANEEKGLPLPWWHRAPLGLSNNTSVFVALTVASEGRPVADLIVTVLNPSRWSQMFRLDCYRKDEPGVVADVLQKVPPLNIALAETVKLEKGDLHHVSLICEPACDDQNTPKEIERIKKQLKEGGFDVRAERLPDLPELAWTRAGSVEHGWVMRVKWQKAISTKYSATVNEADLTKVVASADTESRVLRYVFPRHGAMTVSIKHADEPGALAEIIAAIRSCDLNILSSFLRRGGGGGVDAELVTVCEPTKNIGVGEIESLKGRIEGLVSDIPQRFRPQLRISDGKYAEETIYTKHPEEMVARVPRNLSWAVHDFEEQLKGEVSSNKVIPIFLSHRFSEGTQGSLTLENVREALKSNGCFPVEAESSVAREPVSIYIDVSSKLWAAQAGVFLVNKEADNKHISINLAHELGFLMGQGKAVLMLVEDAPECIELMNSFANIAGVLFQLFSLNVGKESRKSIHSRISAWVKNVRSELDHL